jgi:hypothetical protein
MSLVEELLQFLRLDVQETHLVLGASLASIAISLKRGWALRLKLEAGAQGCNRTPAQKHVPGKNTLIRVPPTISKSWLESTNQLELRRRLMQFEEESSVIIARQLRPLGIRVLPFLNA